MVVLLAVAVIGGLVWLVRLTFLIAAARARTARARTAPGRVCLTGRSAESGSLPR